jgi:hypothetical protein
MVGYVLGHHEVKHLYGLLHALREVKQALAGDISTSRPRPTTAAEWGFLDVARTKVLTMFYSAITARAAVVFEDRFTALLAYLRENQLDVLSAYFETKWVGGGERPPSTWAQCYRSDWLEPQIGGGELDDTTADMFFQTVRASASVFVDLCVCECVRMCMFVCVCMCVCASVYV